ncbi:MAG: heme o synthase [Nitriliruptoraceae bacterium]
MDGQGTAVATGGPTPDGPGPLHPGDARPLDGRRAKLRAYVLVTKPRIIELLLVTTVPTMVVAAGGWPSTWLVVATVVGGTLSAASANTLNNLIDRDVDRLMSRTASRPTVSGAVSPRGALTLGLVLGVAGFAWLWVFVNLVAALLATGAILFYVFVYTLGMKRRTPQAVVIGGIAGCVPVLTGWAAVTGGDLADPRPWLLFAVLLWWQPPHFWALAMRFREDYARADLPMLPVAYGNDEATRQILLHSYLLMAVVVLAAAGAFTGVAFVVPAVALTGWWLVLAHRLRRGRTVTEAQALFKFSTVHLTLVFLAAAVEAVL